MDNPKANLAKAVLKVMKAVSSVEKNTNVGTGRSSYKGVSDKDVKIAFQKAFIDANLVILPIKVTPRIHIDSWEEVNQQYNTTKLKRSVFTEVDTEYLLIHAESGESQVIVGYGHGVDSQDKSCGKSTTYALKYTLLYTFLTPTGDIDDSDNTHSNDIPNVPANKQKPQQTQQKKTVTEVKKTLTEEAFQKALKFTKPEIEKLLRLYNVTPEHAQELTAKIESLSSGAKKEPTKEEENTVEVKAGETGTDIKPKELPKLTKGSDDWKKVVGYIEDGTLVAMSQVQAKFKVTVALTKTIKGLIATKQVEIPEQQERKPAIPIAVYKEVLKMEKLDIIPILEKYRMSADQRKTLENLSK